MKSPRFFRRAAVALAAGAALAVSPLAVTTASAAPRTAEENRAIATTLQRDASGSPMYVIGLKNQAGAQDIAVWSDSMGRYLLMKFLVPQNHKAGAKPVTLLLNGAGGGEDEASWDRQTDAYSFLADKGSYVVTPMSGAFSYYTDWNNADPTLGYHPKWQTFLNEELVPRLSAAVGKIGGSTTDKRAAIGMSMTGTTVLNVAIAKPGYWSSIASYSGCASTSDPAGAAFIRMVLDRGGVNPDNMWGPSGSNGWRANDPLLHAGKLRGTDMYIYSGFGLPGVHDRVGDPYVMNSPLGHEFAVGNQIIVGGGIEAATGACTVALQHRLQQEGIPATIDIRPDGTHSWGYWRDALHRSWGQIAGRIGANG